MKLLKAFIEASGYEIEEVVNIEMAMTPRWGKPIPTKCKTTDYKVTKKQTETEYLLSSEANVERLLESIKQVGDS